MELCTGMVGFSSQGVRFVTVVILSLFSQDGVSAMYDTIHPNFPCYKNMLGTKEYLDDLVEKASFNADLQVSIQEFGTTVEGRPMEVFQITGNGANDNDKGILYLECAIHAREWATSEICSRWAGHLVDNYGIDADITAVLDHAEIHIVSYANPDGRAISESGDPYALFEAWHRKNANEEYVEAEDLTCTGEQGATFGVDCNRNFPFLHALPTGAPTSYSGSDDPCASVFYGPSGASEPETQAIVDYASSIFPESQRKDDPEDEASFDIPYTEATTNGIYIDLHAYGNVVAWSWAFEGTVDGTTRLSPNEESLHALGRKMQVINNELLMAGPLQTECRDGNELTEPDLPDSIACLYPVPGGSSEWGYGVLGAAGYTLEFGTAFHQNCNTFENNIVEGALDVLTYAAKVSRYPYVTPKGPEISNVDADAVVFTSSSLTISATVSDSDSIISEDFAPFQQNIQQVCLFIDGHPYDADAPSCNPMTLSNVGTTVTASFSETVNDLGLSSGRHTVFLQGQDSDDVLGPVTAMSFRVFDLPSGPVDIFFLVDTSGSFTEDLPLFKAEAPDLITGILEENPQTQFGVGTFQDYPIGPYGLPGDEAYVLLQTITDNIAAVNGAIDDLSISGEDSGDDFMESQLTALYQAATGEGQNVNDGEYIIPEGQHAGFREGATKLIVLWTDATFHRAEDDDDYPGYETDDVLAALSTGGVVVEDARLRRGRRLDVEPPISVIGISRGGNTDVINDLTLLASGSGAIAGVGGVDCDGDGISDVDQGQPIVCPGVTGSGEAIAMAINNALIAVFETLVPVEAVCKSISVMATFNCEATITPTQIDDGSFGFNILLSIDEDTLGVGEHDVTLSATDGNGDVDSATCTVTVLDEYISLDEVSCGLPGGGDWDIIESPDSVTASVVKANGCSAEISVVQTPLCERCNDEGMVDYPECFNGVSLEGSDTISVSNIADGAGTFIRWRVTAVGDSRPGDQLVFFCGRCVQDGTFECPLEKPSRVDLDSDISWPQNSVTESDGIPPTISCPDDIVVGNDPGQCGAIVMYDVPEGEDNWCAFTVLSGGLGSGGFFEVGMVHVETYTVEDAAGLTASCNFTITVNDVEPPVASCVPGPNPSGNVPQSNNQDGFWTVSATDNCEVVTFDIKDSGSEELFPGTFDSEGTNIQYVVANKFRQRNGQGAVDYRLTGLGVAEVIAVDEAMNMGTVTCVA